MVPIKAPQLALRGLFHGAAGEVWILIDPEDLRFVNHD